MSARSTRRRVMVALAATLLLESLAISPALAGPGPQSAGPTGAGMKVSASQAFEPSQLESSAGAARAALRARALPPLHRHPAGSRRPMAVERLDARATRPATDNGSSPRAEAGLDAVAGGMGILHTGSHLTNYDTTGGMVGGKVVYGTPYFIVADPHLPNGNNIKTWELPAFFAVPNDEYYFGATVSASIFQGRWVAALPTFKADCTTGYMNVAVSTSTDPTKTWRRFRISMGDAWSDVIRIGVSDNKVVLATNRWDLDDAQPDCLGAPYEGARLRVADWADLLDGGTVTSKDVSPSTSTNYFAFAPATNVATSSTTTTGATLYVAGDKFANGTWGNLVFGTITGGAKSGSAALARNENLTSSGEVALLNGPPETIAAFSSGNGFQDERVLSSTYRSGRMWLSSTGSCMLAEDTAPRACARYVLLNTTTTPASEIESAYLTEVERDTFLPFVGFARNGRAFFTMAASSAVAQEPIDELATFRSGGGVLVGGDSEVTILEGLQTINDDYFGMAQSVMAVPNAGGAVIAAYSGVGLLFQDQSLWGTWATELQGGATSDPGGTFAQVGNGSGFAMTRILALVLRPNTSVSPIKTFRYSASPDVESTSGGSRLINGRDVPSQAWIWDDFSLAELGGTSVGPTVTVYGQWQTFDGTWSPPISSTLTLDTELPVVTGLKASFGSGTVGASAPIKLSWSASDALSGLGFIEYFENRISPAQPVTQFSAVLPVTATSYTRSLHISSSYRYELYALISDKAENGVNPNIEVSVANVPTSVNIAFVKTWSTSSNTKYLGGSTKYATASGATVTYSFSGRAIAFISTKSPSRGKAEVWIDGVKQSTIDLYSSTTKYRQIAYQTSWDAVGNHTIMIKVLGTSGRARIDFDSFLKAY